MKGFYPVIFTLNKNSIKVQIPAFEKEFVNENLEFDDTIRKARAVIESIVAEKLSIGEEIPDVIHNLEEEKNKKEKKTSVVFVDWIVSDEPTISVTETLFEETEACFKRYMSLPETSERKEYKRQQFCSLFAVIEKAGLEDEYEEWREER